MDAFGTISKLGGGHFMELVNAELVRVADEVLATGKDGKVTITLKVKMQNPKSGEPIVIVTEEIGATLPKDDPRGAFFYAVDGEFHTRDPRQAELPFRRVETPDGEMRPAPDENGAARKEAN